MNLLTRVSLVSGLAGLCALFPTSVKVSTQNTERVVDQVHVPSQPAELMEIRNKHGKVFRRGKVDDDDEWMDGLTVGLRNTSTRAITYAQVTLDFPKAENSSESAEPPLRYFLYFGTREKPDAAAPQPSIKPGEVVELTLTEERYGVLKRHLRELKYSRGIKKVKMTLHTVVFDDDLMWSLGELMRRDPHDPHKWRPIGQLRAPARPSEKKS
jgi:hypothetical protein